MASRIKIKQTITSRIITSCFTLMRLENTQHSMLHCITRKEKDITKSMSPCRILQTIIWILFLLLQEIPLLRRTLSDRNGLTIIFMDWFGLLIRRKRNINFIVLAGFLWKLPLPLVRRYEGRIINIHPALLPKHGGRGMYGHNVHDAVIAAGESRIRIRNPSVRSST